MDHDPINPNHYPKLHAYLKTQAMLPWGNKLDQIVTLIKEDEKLYLLINVPPLSSFRKSHPLK
jgi:hypothetical protein